MSTLIACCSRLNDTQCKIRRFANDRRLGAGDGGGVLVHTPIALPGRRRSPKPSSTFLEALVDCLLRLGSSPPLVRGKRNSEVVGTLIGLQTDRCVHESKRRDRCRRRSDTSWMALSPTIPTLLAPLHPTPGSRPVRRPVWPVGPQSAMLRSDSNELPIKTRNQAIHDERRSQVF